MICGLPDDVFSERLTFCYLAGMPDGTPKRVVEWLVHQNDTRMFAASVLLAVNDPDVHPRGASGFYRKLNAELLRFAEDEMLREPKISVRQWAAVETGVEGYVEAVRREVEKMMKSDGREGTSDE